MPDLKEDGISLEELIVEEPEIQKEEIINGDENYKSIVMPDGTFNDKYILTFEDIVEEEQQLVPFKYFPTAIKNDILRKSIIAIAVIMLSVILKLFAVFTSTLMFVFIGFSLLLLFSALIKYRTCRKDKVIKFEGIIVDVQTVGILKSDKLNIVKISNNEKFLNVKLSPNKSLRVGLPITLYINKAEPIIDSNYGPLVENIISYALNVSDKEDIEAFAENNEISVEDYLK